MAYYDNLGQIMNYVIAELLKNQTFCKLLYYYPDQTTFTYNPLAQPDIEDTNSTILMQHLFPLPKIPDADTEQNCFVNVTMTGGGYMEKNKGFRKVNLTFDIICHLDTWMIKGGYRPLKILSEIDKMFNDQPVSDLNIENKPQPLPLNPVDYSNKFYGYQTSYMLIVNSNVKC